MPQSTREHQAELQQIELRGQIADEKTSQLEWKLYAEMEKTRISEIKAEEAGVDRQIAEVELEGKYFDLDKSRSDRDVKLEGSRQAETALGMARDNSIALEAKRSINQLILAEDLTTLSLKASQMREENAQSIATFSALYESLPSLESTGYFE